LDVVDTQAVLEDEAASDALKVVNDRYSTFGSLLAIINGINVE
jgi:hypothetical protein